MLKAVNRDKNTVKPWLQHFADRIRKFLSFQRFTIWRVIYLYQTCSLVVNNTSLLLGIISMWFKWTLILLVCCCFEKRGTSIKLKDYFIRDEIALDCPRQRHHRQSNSVVWKFTRWAKEEIFDKNWLQFHLFSISVTIFLSNFANNSSLFLKVFKTFSWVDLPMEV